MEETQNISVEQPFLLEDKSGQIHIEFNFKHCGAIKDPKLSLTSDKFLLL